ncbi:MAG: hypothetical protein ACTJIB_12865 [Pseudoalteromonas prydzensis]|uniref:hypothetical protein n=1 Tax=Pseudoalteromonas prydzensis TaxID=182141 RepID=UPI003F9954A7
MYIQIYSCSDGWILQPDNVTEQKQLIGLSDEGYHFGYILGWPDSEPHWNQTAYESVELAENAQVDEFFRMLDFEEDRVYTGEFCFVLDSPSLKSFSKDYIEFLEVPF